METARTTEVDWRGCELVEIVSGKVSGAPLLRGTRMPVQTIVNNLKEGMTLEEVAATWHLPLDDVRSIWSFARRQRAHTS